MSEIKVGDRVRVEFDGTVEDTIGVPAREVFINDGDNSLWTAASHCTVIVPPIAVGDVVDAENIGHLPPESIIVSRYEVGRRNRAAWFFDGDSHPYDLDAVLRKMARVNFTILRIGGGESS